MNIQETLSNMPYAYPSYYQCETVQEIADFLTELVIEAKENK